MIMPPGVVCRWWEWQWECKWEWEWYLGVIGGFMGHAGLIAGVHI